MPYTPKPPPRSNPEFQELYDYIEQELQGISRELLGTSELELRTTSREPARPREGMIVQADGTTWNPGEGAGTYKYEGGNWVRFGDADHVHTLVDITDAGTLAALDEVALSDIADIATQRVIGRNTAGTGIPEQVSLTQLLDWIGSAARGDILVRGASTWARLAKGAADTYLKSDGTDPAWATLPSTGWTDLQENTPSSGTTSDFINIDQSHKILLFMGTDLNFTATTFGTVRVGATSTFATLRTFYFGTSAGTAGSTTTPSALNQTTNSTTWFVMAIFDYASTTKKKTGFIFAGRIQNNSAFLGSFQIDTTTAIEHVRFQTATGNFAGGNIRMVGLL